MQGATTEYDIYSAVTFLLVGLGIGSILAIVFNPKNRKVLANCGTTAEVQPEPEKEAPQQVA